MSTMFRHVCFVLACLAARALAQGGGADAGNLLRNGGFESGGTHDAAQWAGIWPRTILKQAPKFDRAKDGAHGGKACAMLEVPEAGGYCSFTQEIASPPRDAKSVQVEGWIAFTADPKTPGVPSIMLLMVDPSKPGDTGTIQDVKLAKDARGWTKVTFDATVPEGASQWLVRCGMIGCGTARFDDVRVTASAAAIESVALIRAHGDYALVENSSAAKDPWVEFSLPFPFEGQSPLAVRLTTDPPDRVAKVAITQDQENRHLRVHVKPQGKASARTTVRLDALVMVRERPVSKSQATKLVSRGKVPPAVAHYFEKTPGIDAEDAEIQAIAKGVKTETLEQAVEGVLAWMREHFKYEGGGDQGGRASLARKYAVCTGHANLAASLFQAAGVPCRILGCVMSDRLQEHYIVEVWTPADGWRRIESTSKAFPIPDAAHLILHVAHPKFFRSPGNVPLYICASQGCTGQFDVGKDTCWQGMGRPLSLGVDPADAVLLESTARAAFTAWEQSPSSVPIRLLPPALPGLGKKGAKVMADVEAFLAEKE